MNKYMLDSIQTRTFISLIFVNYVTDQYAARHKKIYVIEYMGASVSVCVCVTIR